MGTMDIIVIAILAVFALIGFVKGFLNTILSLFGNLASLAVAIVIVKPCTKFFDSVFKLVDKLGGALLNGVATLLPELSDKTMSGADVISHLNGGGLLGRLTAMFVDSSATYGAGATDLNATLSTNMGQFATTIVTVLIMFVLIRFGVFLLSKIFDAITKKSAISGLDRLLGFICGFIKGAIIVTCALSIMYTLSPIFPKVNEWISNASFSSWLYGYINQLIDWIINSVDWKSIAQIA